MKRRSGYNAKRGLAPLESLTPKALADMASKAVYTGNPAHKKIPGDFGLQPPAAPRPDATLCDRAGVFKKEMAERLLRDGIERGLVDERRENGWPRTVWAVATNGKVFEAELENRAMGHYHGYPLLDDDPFRIVVLDRANGRRTP